MWAEMPNILKNVTFELPVLKNSYQNVLYKQLMPGALKPLLEGLLRVEPKCTEMFWREGFKAQPCDL